MGRLDLPDVIPFLLDLTALPSDRIVEAADALEVELPEVHCPCCRASRAYEVEILTRGNRLFWHRSV